jgi:putative phosphoribosyl transferase
MIFADRVEAGQQLALALERFRGPDVVVLGLPRGGVPVARQIADALGAPLDVVVVRKLGAPSHQELAMGAIGEGGVRVVSRDIVRSVGATDEDVAEVETFERAELERRARQFRGDRERADLTGKTAIVVDDGIATGATARAACQVVRALGASRIVLATPVAPPGLEHRLADVADEFVFLDQPRHFAAVGQFYADFDQTSDAQVIEALSR